MSIPRSRMDIGRHVGVVYLHNRDLQRSVRY
jgi:hypothetical protein